MNLKIPLFQSTHPMRGATSTATVPSRVVMNFNPRTPCGVRQVCHPRVDDVLIISIHAPHAGCDLDIDDAALIAFDISIHAPHAGCDFFVVLCHQLSSVFQSTHPMRGATPCAELTFITFF